MPQQDIIIAVKTSGKELLRSLAASLEETTRAAVETQAALHRMRAEGKNWLEGMPTPEMMSHTVREGRARVVASFEGMASETKAAIGKMEAEIAAFSKSDAPKGVVSAVNVMGARVTSSLGNLVSIFNKETERLNSILADTPRGATRLASSLEGSIGKVSSYIKEMLPGIDASMKNLSDIFKKSGVQPKHLNELSRLFSKLYGGAAQEARKLEYANVRINREYKDQIEAIQSVMEALRQLGAFREGLAPEQAAKIGELVPRAYAAALFKPRPHTAESLGEPALGALQDIYIQIAEVLESPLEDMVPVFDEVRKSVARAHARYVATTAEVSDVIVNRIAKKGPQFIESTFGQISKRLAEAAGQIGEGVYTKEGENKIFESLAKVHELMQMASEHIGQAYLEGSIEARDRLYELLIEAQEIVDETFGRGGLEETIGGKKKPAPTKIAGKPEEFVSTSEAEAKIEERRLERARKTEEMFGRISSISPEIAQAFKMLFKTVGRLTTRISTLGERQKETTEVLGSLGKQVEKVASQKRRLNSVTEEAANKQREEKEALDKLMLSISNAARKSSVLASEGKKTGMVWDESVGLFRSLASGLWVTSEAAARAGFVEGPEALVDVTRRAISVQESLADVLLSNIAKIEKWGLVAPLAGQKVQRAFELAMAKMSALTPEALEFRADPSSIDKVADSLRTLLAKLRGQLGTALTAPGLGSEATQNLVRMYQELDRLLVKMEEFGIRTREAAVETRAFNEVAASLADILAKGSESATAFARSFMAATPEQRAAASGLTSMAQKIDSVAKAVGVEFKPQILEATNYLRDLATSASDIVPAALDKAQESVARIGAAISQVLAEQREKMSNIAPAEGRKGLERVVNVLSDAQRQIMGVGSSLDSMRKRMDKTTSTMSSAASVADAHREELRKLHWEAREGRLTWRPYQSVFQGIMTGMSIASGNIRNLMFNLVFLGAGIKKVVIRWAALSAVIFGFLGLAKKAIQAVVGMARSFATAGQEADTLMNKLRPFVATTRDMGRAFDYAQSKAVKFGRAPDDAVEAMQTLTKAGLGNEEMFEAVAMAAVANSKTIADSASTFVSAIGEEKGSLEQLRDLRVDMNANTLNEASRMVRAEQARIAVTEQLAGAYKDVAQSAEQSLARIKQGWKAIWSFLSAPVWQKVFVPLLHYLANFIATLAEFARGLAYSEAAQDHLNRTMAIFRETIDEYGPELQWLASVIKGVIVVAFKMLLGAVRAMVLAFRFLMQVIRALTPLFSKLASIGKHVRDILMSLFPKGLKTRIRLWWSGLKEEIGKLWNAIVEDFEELKQDVYDFFHRNKIGIAIRIIFEWAWSWIKTQWENLKQGAVDWWNNVGSDWVNENPFGALVMAVNLLVGLGGVIKWLWKGKVVGGMKSAFLVAGAWILENAISVIKDLWVTYSLWLAVDILVETFATEDFENKWDEFKASAEAYILENPIRAFGIWLGARTAIRLAGRAIGGSLAYQTAVAFFAKLGPALELGWSTIGPALGTFIGGIGLALGGILLAGFVGELSTGIPVVSDAAHALVEYGFFPAFHTFSRRFGQMVMTTWIRYLDLIARTLETAINGIMQLPSFQRLPEGIKKTLGLDQPIEINWFDGMEGYLEEQINQIDQDLAEFGVEWADRKVAEAVVSIGLDPDATHEEVVARFSELVPSLQQQLQASAPLIVPNFDFSASGLGETGEYGQPAWVRMADEMQESTSGIQANLGTLTNEFSLLASSYSTNTDDMETSTTDLADKVSEKTSAMKSDFESFTSSVAEDCRGLRTGELASLIGTVDNLKSSLDALPREITIRIKADVDEEIETRSPPPLEVGLRGIMDAMQGVKQEARGMSVAMTSMPAITTGGAVVGVGGGGSTTININVSVSGNTISGPDGAKDLADQTAREIMRRLTAKAPIATIR